MEIKDLVASIAAKHTEIETALKATGADASAGQANALKALDQVKTLSNQFSEIEAKLADRVSKGQEAPATLGNLAVTAAGIKAFIDGSTARGSFESKAPLLGQVSGNADTSVIVPVRQAGIVSGPLRVLTLLDYMPTMPIASTLLEYTQEAFFNNAAAMRAEGAASAESEIGFALKSVPVRNIATHINVSKEVLKDAPQLAAYIDTRLTHGLRLKLEAQIAAGDGVGQSLSGMTDVGNFTLFTPTASETAVDGVNRAIEAVMVADYAADIVLLNPSDWATISRLKTSTGEYLVGEPVGGAIALRLWGLPVVPCKAIPAGKQLVTSMAMAYSYFEKEGVTVEVFTQHSDNAIKGLVTVQASARGALASFRPASVRYGDLTA